MFRLALGVTWMTFVAVAFVDVEGSKCEKLSELAALEDHKTIVETSPRLLAGTWVSEGCEIRPGPEYVLRSYTFETDGKFTLIQHHYWDDSCSSPQLTIISNGRIQLRASLIQPGAASGFIRMNNITIIPQDHNAAKELDRVASIECPGQYSKSWRQYAEHTVYDSRYDEKRKIYNLWMEQHSINRRVNNVHFSDISCLGSLKWAFNELKLIKVQLRPIVEDSKKFVRHMKMELLLGDIHSNLKLREYYNPTSFQVPLIKQLKEDTVFLNRHRYIIKNSNTMLTSIFAKGKTPPHLIEKPHLPPYIWGEWTSTRCEIRPMGIYLTRKFIFYSEDLTWVGDHKFYSDPFCKLPKFSVTAAGHTILKEPNKELRGTTNIDFQIERASLTVLDERTIDELRLRGLCGQGEWEVNIPKELSSTNGCIQLGIIIPSVLHDIVKLEMDYKGSCLLFLGQVETDSLHSTSTERPTAFQLPLVKCGDVASYSPSLRDILNNNLYYNSACSIRLKYVLKLIFIMYIFFR